MQAEPSHPMQLGEFVLGEKLGEGGFGTVYRAEQRTLGRPAVVKLIRHSLAQNRDNAERFTLEARLASRFDHPYAAHVYAFGVESDGAMWIAMELVNGTPLNELIDRGGAMPLERFVPLMERLCEVIQSAHDQQIVHRDIKPSNIMVISRAGRLMPKLLDFGIAKALVAPPDRTQQVPTVSSRPKRKVADPVALDNTLDADTMDASVGATGGTQSTLTQVGQILGSPPYMAPEQWVDAAGVGPWTDQYALALVAYEVLSGKRAFEGTTIDSWYDAHVQRPLPALPSELPIALHAVLARAAAKTPADRFASLSELAAAFRAAALDGQPVVPSDGPAIELPGELVARWIARAPQPIAETLAALVATRAQSKLVDRARATASVLARWLGMLALAGQSRIGRIVPGTPAHALVVEVRRQTLRDADWLELAGALVSTFAAQPAAWPMPELAESFADDRLKPLRELVRDDAIFDTSEGAMRSQAELAMARIEETLAALDWLLGYELVRTTRDGHELWTGATADERAVRPAAVRQPGELLVIDADGGPVLELAPLVTLARPLPGEREEMFVFVGPARTGDASRGRCYPRGFERDDHAVWEWLATRLLDLDDATAPEHVEERSPYPGLAAFTTDDHASFVGRETDTEQLMNRLRTQAVVAVVGPSGVGKSSFLAAGVIPALPAAWRAETIRPGATPVVALQSILLRSGNAPYRDQLDREVPSEPIALGEALAAVARTRGGTLLVVIDQAEELFTMCGGEAERETFARALVTASDLGSVRVVLSLRDDYLCRADDLGAWRGVLARGVQVLRVPAVEDLERAVRVPARRCGYQFDDPTLPKQLVAELSDRPGALPLIAFTAAALWEQRDRHFKRLTRSAYDAIGGVAGALVKHADGIVDGMPATDRRLVRRAFRRLLTSEGTRALLGRDELVEALGGDAAAVRVIDKLIAARLVVSRDEDSGERIEIIHESLVSTWPRLATWRHEDAATTRLQDRLSAAARAWIERGRAPGLLWSGAALADIQHLRRDAVTLTPNEQAFARASEQAARRSQRRRIGVVAGAFTMLAVGAAGLAWANHRISGQREAAVDRLAAGFEERARQSIDDGDATHAALYLAESRRLGGHGIAGDLIAARAAAALEPELEVIGHTASAIENATIDARGVITIGSDEKVRVWQYDGRETVLAEGAATAHRIGEVDVYVGLDGRLGAQLAGHRWQRDHAVEPGVDNYVIGAEAARLLVSMGTDAKLWNLDDGTLLGSIAHEAPLTRVALDRAGKLLALGDVRGGVDIWDTATRQRVTTCAGHERAIKILTFSHDARQLFVGGDDSQLSVFDASTGALVRRLVGHRHRITEIVATADGQTLASGSRDGTIILWNLQTGQARVAMDQRGSVINIELSPDGRRLYSTSRDGVIRLWDAASGTALGSLQGNASGVVGARWDGTSIVTASVDGSIRRWDADRAIRTTVDNHGAAIAALDVAGDVTLTAGVDGRAMAWSRSTHQPLATITQPGLRVARLSPDGQTILAVDADGVAALWAVRGGAKLAQLASTGVTAASYLPDGTFVTSATDKFVRFWRGDGAPIAQLAIDFAATSLTADPQNRWLAASADQTGRLAIVDLSSRTVSTVLPALARHNVAFVDGRLAVTHQNVIQLFALGTWRPLGELVGHQAWINGIWSLSDGRLLSASDDAVVLVWDRAGQLVQPLANDKDPVWVAAQSPDGSLVATIGFGGVLRIFDARTQQRLLTLPAHRSSTFQLRFSPDSTSVITGGMDGMAITHDVRHPVRTASELVELVRCRVPLRLDGDVAVPRKLDFADATCHR